MIGRLALALTALALVAAGCVTPAADVDAAAAEDLAALEASRLPAPTEDLSAVIVPDHGAPYLHALPQLHSGSYGMELVGYNPLSRDGEVHPLAANSGHGAITIFGHIACVSGFAGTGGVGGAILVDFEDPTDPVVLSSIPTTSLQARCQFTDDGKYLMLASYGGVTPTLPLPPPFHDVVSWGISFYDVADPANPVFLFHDAQGASAGDAGAVTGGPYHNVDSETVDNVTYVFQTYYCNVLKVNEDASGLELVAKLEHCNHDFWTGVHPITGMRMLVTGTNAAGTAFIDITDPSKPITVGVFESEDETFEGWHRQWPLAEPVDGKALIVVAGEQCGNGKSLPYHVLDWTDPAAPAQLGSWIIPGEPEITGPGPHLCDMNSHEFMVHKGYVASGNYHAGVWLFDVGTPTRAAEPVTIGYYLPDQDPRMHGGTRNTPFVWSPDVWGAYFDDRGYVLAADWYSGFYVLKVPGLTEDGGASADADA